MTNKVPAPSRDIRIKDIAELQQQIALPDMRVAGNQLPMLLQTLKDMHKAQELEVRRAYEAVDRKEAEEHERSQIVVDMH